MSSETNLPEDVLEAIRFINAAKDKSYLSRADKDNLNRARLRIAYYACRSENIIASRENLTYVLGADAAEIMGSYDRYLEREDSREKDKSGSKRKRGGKKSASGFWENA